MWFCKKMRQNNTKRCEPGDPDNASSSRERGVRFFEDISVFFPASASMSDGSEVQISELSECNGEDRVNKQPGSVQV